jgi:hypothetical protein
MGDSFLEGDPAGSTLKLLLLWLEFVKTDTVGNLVEAVLGITYRRDREEDFDSGERGSVTIVPPLVVGSCLSKCC